MVVIYGVMVISLQVFLRMEKCIWEFIYLFLGINMKECLIVVINFMGKDVFFLKIIYIMEVSGVMVNNMGEVIFIIVIMKLKLVNGVMGNQLEFFKF